MEITQLLQAVGDGTPRASEQLFAVLYDELKRMANLHMRRESSGHTLQPTALVHETYMRLLGSSASTWENRSHFFGAASEAMRRILIESARAKSSLKRGGDRDRETLDQDPSDIGPLADDILDVNEALVLLEGEDADLARIVKLRFFGGLQMDQIAEIEGISKSTAERRWTFAKAWLTTRLGSRQEP
jgi:RNA polymerase sigma factor (TIGR02999 family)